MILSFNDFIHKYGLKNKATSNIKIQSVCQDRDIYLRNGDFEPDIGMMCLHPTKGTHGVAYINEIFFDSYGCPTPQKLSSVIIKRNGHCFYSECNIEFLDFYCGG